MATKKDLIEAQGFSRRRLLSAFTGGAPGGKELDPAKPLRAVVAGVALTAGIILAGVFYGIMQPGLPQDWKDNRMIIATDTGARYVSFDGTLYPVINTSSARLLIPANDFTIIKTDEGSLADIPIGPAIGILGAPDDLPEPDALLNTAWTACVDEAEGTAVSISDAPIAKISDGTGAVVRRDDDIFVISGGLRYAVSPDEANAVLRAVGLGTSDIVDVDGLWLNLFQPGEELAPITVSGFGDAVAGTDLRAGTIVHVQGSAEDERYVALASGELAQLSPLAHQLYLLGSGADAGPEQEVSPAEVAAVPTTSNAGGADWPTRPLEILPSGETPCAVLGGDAVTALGSTASELPEERGTAQVSVGGGALVQIGVGGEESVSTAVLIDGSGTAFSIPAAGTGDDGGDDSIRRLGYSAADVGQASNEWIQFFSAGPALTSEAAGMSPGEGAAE